MNLPLCKAQSLPINPLGQIHFPVRPLHVPPFEQWESFEHSNFLHRDESGHSSFWKSVPPGQV